ncbi:MAG: hypothetical protein JW841_10500 [Deltaproteobacteria bacterium]|nr:hypothetical protein [Deltaproteobacteria bacterium]
MDVIATLQRLTAILETEAIEYAIGGAIALSYWAVPRATLDIDIGINVEPTTIPQLLVTLEQAGCIVNHDTAMIAAERGDFGARLKDVRIDIFLPTLPFAADAFDRKIRVPLADNSIWILAAEDIALYKLIYGRTKDYADLERLFSSQLDQLDLTYLDKWINKLFASDDSRKHFYLNLRAKIIKTHKV